MIERKESFWYTTGWSGAMAAVGAIAAAPIAIDSDAPFVALRMTVKVMQANVLVANFAGTMLMEYAGRGFFSNVAVGVPIDEFVTAGSAPYELVPPITFPAGCNLQITFISNVVTNTQCNLTLHGYKYFTT